MIAEIWNSILYFTVVLKPPLQLEVTIHCLYTVQTVLNVAAGSFCCKITLICLGSSLSVLPPAGHNVNASYPILTIMAHFETNTKPEPY